MPNALKNYKNPTLRIFLSSACFYLAFLGLTGHPWATPPPMSRETLYALAGLGTYLGFLSPLRGNLKKQSKVIRIYLLHSLEHLRLENMHGTYMDVPIADVQLRKTDTDSAVLHINIEGKQKVTVNLKDAAFFDPELLYAVTNGKVARITPGIYTS